MNVGDILKPEAVRLLPDLGSKKRLFQKLGDCASATYGLQAEGVVSALLERESLGPTGVGKGIALPHARMPGVSQVCAIFARLERPLEYDSVDRQPVDLVFALVAPEASGVEHLKALALASRTMRDSNICAKLRANADVATLHTILTDNTATKAA